MTLLKYGNAKLHNTLVFNLPATQEVCGRVCPGCYAIKAQRIYPNVLPYRERMLAASRSSSFTTDILTDIQSCRKPFQFIRIHESGEFYSQDYIDSWTAIASSVPDKTFYAYTKRLKDFDFSAFKALPNTVLIDSLHFGGINYGPLSSAPAGAPICPTHSDKSILCGQSCTLCMQKSAEQTGVFFVKH